MYKLDYTDDARLDMQLLLVNKYKILDYEIFFVFICDVCITHIFVRSTRNV